MREVERRVAPKQRERERERELTERVKFLSRFRVMEPRRASNNGRGLWRFSSEGAAACSDPLEPRAETDDGRSASPRRARCVRLIRGEARKADERKPPMDVDGGEGGRVAFLVTSSLS